MEKDDRPLKSKVAYDQLKPSKERGYLNSIVDVSDVSVPLRSDGDLNIPPLPVQSLLNIEDEPRNGDLPIIERTAKRKSNVVPDDHPVLRKSQRANGSKASKLQRGVDMMCNELIRGRWLTDEHIDQSQALLKLSFPDVGGLQPVCVFVAKDCRRISKPTTKFVQMLNVGGNHWITLSTIGCCDEEITVYDSMYSGLGELSLPTREIFLKQVCCMLHSSTFRLSIQWADTQKQNGSSDCGLFSIAAATALCNGVKPQECNWDQNEMRQHLVNCFKAKSLELFPVSSTRSNVDIRDTSSIELFCHCRQPEVTGVFMIRCDGCDGWYHRKCEQVPKTVSSNTKFFCRLCRE